MIADVGGLQRGHRFDATVNSYLPDVLLAPGVPGPAGSAGDRMTVFARRSVVGPPLPTPAPRRIGALELATLLDMPAPTEEQVEVIEAGPGPAVVIAGAGSGKTETMASRVVWLVANGLVPADAVLGLTFTRKAATELGARIRRRMRAWARHVEPELRTQTAGRGTDRADLRRLLGAPRRRSRVAPGSRTEHAADLAGRGLAARRLGRAPVHR